jgi:hypothetical protein
MSSSIQPEIGLAAGTTRLHDVGAAQRPRQDGLCAQQVAHAQRAGKIGAEQKFARFEQFLCRGVELLDSGNALATGKLDHRRGEIGVAALDLPPAPHKTDFGPAPLPGMAEGTEGARQVLHEALQRAP